MSGPFDPPLNRSEIVELYPGLEVGEKFPDGGQGSVFHVEFEEENAVLKIYKNADFTRGKRECQALEKLNSQNIVQLFKWGEIDVRGETCIYTIAKLVEGELLSDRIKRKALSEGEARHIGRDIVGVIYDIWNLDRIVHRDIKPNNIILRSDGSAVVIDLGIARHTQLSTETEWGYWVGTRGYMSPEQARGRRQLTYRSDFFSLGIVLYEVLSQQHPFNWDQRLIGHHSPQPIKSITGISEELNYIIHKLLEPDPIDRPRGFDELLSIL